MTRLALAIVVTAAAGVVILTDHPKRPAPAASAPSMSDWPLRAARSQEERQPLPRVKAPSPGQGVSRPVSVRRARPAPGSRLSDVTMYCATGNRNADGRWPELGDVAVINRSIPFGTRVLIEGNVYTVRDWIGWGSDFDIYGGNDAGCERRALDFGRRRLRVVVER